MRENHDTFDPASVDEEIEQAKLQQPGRSLSGEHSDNHPVDGRAHLVNRLHAITQQQAESTKNALDEAWQSIVTSRQYQRHVGLQQTDREKRLVTAQRLGSMATPHNKISDQTGTILSVKQRSRRMLSILAAVACIALVVGSMLWIVQIAKNGARNPSVVTQPTTPPIITPHTQRQVNLVYTYTQGGDVGISSIYWSPNGDRVLSVGSQIQVWDFNKTYLSLNSSGLSSAHVVWSPDGKSIAINSLGNGIEIRDATTGQVQRTCPTPTLPGQGLPGADIQSTPQSPLLAAIPYNQQFANSSGLGHYLAWSPNGQYLASTFSEPGSGSNFVGLIVYATADCHIVWQPSGSAYDAIAWSPDSKYLAWFDGANVEIQNFTTRQHIYAYPGDRNTEIVSISWSPDGQRIAMLASGHITAWDALTGTHSLTYQETNDKSYVRAFSWSPDSQYIVSITNSFVGPGIGSDIRIRSARTDQTIYASPDHTGSSAVTWSPDGKYIAVGHTTYKGQEQATVSVWQW